ncbi:hypothetical protein [Candidatus Magnetominusculus xianensis]|uniref:Uncharacterized protein n=1 Tax=Candidatus Magnetominusculus xianensis TaxID=1748249 RepID=A0ABR5SBK6_9BACT|nr:hypothetical protein [Candidatus Magnetominusculus xianensis]KWT76850.1 hypothetical protein ASN18_3116 [Candidatus Magnetominusculus xianensis]MBF0402644.1 hypothetical protein [Nitrospirota bacterium]
MTTDDIYDILHETDHVVLSKIINGGTAFLDPHERLIYERIAKHAKKIGWTHERVIWAMQRVMEQQ